MDHEPRQQPSLPAFPASRRLAARRWVKVLVLVDIVVVVAAVSVYLVMRQGDPRGNVANVGLRGSRPPAGQKMPDLSKVSGMEPDMPAPASMRGDVTLVVATCMQCPSGDVIGGALRRLTDRDLPEGARIEVVGWGGDVAAWRAEWKLPKRLAIHVVRTPSSVSKVKVLLGIGTNGFGYLYDRGGVWRASYAVQLLQPDDVVHDMRVLAGA
jgi:hypothetical protein